MTVTDHVEADEGLDLYPSRRGGGPSILERPDPVVWGDGTDGPLDRSQVEAFERDGYLHLTGVLSPDEVRELHDAVDVLAADPEVQAAERTIIEPEGREVRSVFEVHFDAPFDRVVADRRLAGVARQLLADDVYIHQSRVNLKPGFRGKEFYWHSDFETWHTEDGMPRPRAVSASIALTDNHHTNGPLMVIAGSHRLFVTCPGKTPPDHHRESLRRQEIGVPDDGSLAVLAERGEIRDVIGPAGSVTFFDSNTMHGSNGNITPFPRRNAFFVFNAVSNALRDPYAAEQPRPNHIAARKVDPLPHRGR